MTTGSSIRLSDFSAQSRIVRLLGLGIFACAVAWPGASATAQDELDKLPEKSTTTAPSNEPKINLGQLRKLLRQLDGDSSKERDAAEKSLIEIGAPILPFLPEITANTSGELKIRLQRIRDQLQTSKIEVFFEPSVITLSGKMTTSDAIAAIAKQTGNVIELANPEATSNVEVKYDKKPFWEAMDDLMTQARLRIDTYSGTEGMSLVPRQDNSILPGPLPSAAGPFQVVALSAQTSIQYGARSSGQLDISLQVNWEPRLKPVFLEVPMGRMKVILDDGSELMSANPNAKPEVPVNGGAATQLDLQFARPSRSVSKLKTLKGEFTAAVPSEKHKYVFENFGNGKRQSEKYGEVTVTLENARRNGSVYEMRILAEFKDPNGVLDSFRGWILSNRAYLVDAKENRIENVGFQTYTVSSEAVGVAFLFQINDDPNKYTLIYESPGMITRQTVPFELHDIDLP